MAQNQSKEQEQESGQMTVQEAGRKGGEAVVEKYGPEHMAEIGRKGGENSHGGGQDDSDDEGGDGGNASGGQRGGSSEQHARAGQQSHKND